MTFDSLKLQTPSSTHKYARRCSVTAHSFRKSALMELLADVTDLDDAEQCQAPPMKRVKFTQRCSITEDALREAVHFAKIDKDDSSYPRTATSQNATTANVITRQYQRRCSVTERTMRQASRLVIAFDDSNKDCNADFCNKAAATECHRLSPSSDCTANPPTFCDGNCRSNETCPLNHNVPAMKTHHRSVSSQ